jgi:glyceraldehyde 3-phosphate dehydrogenase
VNGGRASGLCQKGCTKATQGGFTMAIRVAINGFGRIGRLIMRVMATRKDFEVVAINDLTDAATLALLLKYDSVHRKFPGEVKADGNNLVIDGKKIPCLKEPVPAKLPWKSMNVDIAAECTGRFVNKAGEKGGFGDHLTAGAKKVLLSAPAKDDKEVDATIVLGVNNEALKKEHKFLSNASCTTNCTAPVVKVINDNFKIVKGMVSTIHAYTNDQSILDFIHKDLRRARAAAINIIPTTTGMSKAIAAVIPELKGKIEGVALRVPVPTGSIIDCTFEVEADVDEAKVNAALKAAAEAGPLKGILEYTEDPIVSTDIIGNPHSSILDGTMTKCVKGQKMLKVLSWYDNEMGFSNRMADLMALAHKIGY